MMTMPSNKSFIQARKVYVQFVHAHDSHTVSQHNPIFFWICVSYAPPQEKDKGLGLSFGCRAIYICHWSLSHVRSFLSSVFLMIIITIISWQESYLFLHLLLLRSQLLATKKKKKVK